MKYYQKIQITQMNQSYTLVNAPYATLTCAYCVSSGIVQKCMGAIFTYFEYCQLRLVAAYA